MNATHRILNRPLAEWPLAINSSKSTPQDLEQDLAALVQRAALLHAYVSERYNTGCGDYSHEYAAKKANRTLVKIRRAMGLHHPFPHTPSNPMNLPSLNSQLSTLN